MSTTTDYQRQLNLIWTRGNKTIQERFEEYHHENPRVFELVVRFGWGVPPAKRATPATLPTASRASGSASAGT